MTFYKYQIGLINQELDDLFRKFDVNTVYLDVGLDSVGLDGLERLKAKLQCLENLFVDRECLTELDILHLYSSALSYHLDHRDCLANSKSKEESNSQATIEHDLEKTKDGD